MNTICQRGSHKGMIAVWAVRQRRMRIAYAPAVRAGQGFGMRILPDISA